MPSEKLTSQNCPSLADAVTGCYLTPYSEKRLDVLAGIPFRNACPGMAKLVLAVGLAEGR
ncbi:hypothetical protein ACP0HM_10450 [Escherichia coli]